MDERRLASEVTSCARAGLRGWGGMLTPCLAWPWLWLGAVRAWRSESWAWASERERRDASDDDEGGGAGDPGAVRGWSVAASSAHSLLLLLLLSPGVRAGGAMRRGAAS